MFWDNLFVLNFFLSLIIFILNYKYRYQISQKLNILDIPDNKRKLHKGSVPLNGALWFSIIIFFFIFQSLLFENLINNQFRLILITSLIIFLIGLIDDIKSINPNLRLIIYFITFYFVISLDETFQLKIVYFESLSFELKTSIFATFFTAFCLTAFINSINLSDGINALANSILTIMCLIIFIKFNEKNPFILLIVLFLFLNSFIIYKQKYFLGDSGALSISTFIGLIIINEYNSNYLSINNNQFNAEDIFVLMAFPGLDMIRVFFERSIEGKNPFRPSREHLHHYLLKKHSLMTTLIIYLFFAFIPSISNFFFQDLFYTTYNLYASITLYIVLLKYSRNKNFVIGKKI